MLFTGRQVRLRMFLADLAIIMLCEIEIFIEISISVRNLFSRTLYNGFWSGALKLANYHNTYQKPNPNPNHIKY